MIRSTAKIKGSCIKMKESNQRRTYRTLCLGKPSPEFVTNEEKKCKLFHF